MKLLIEKTYNIPQEFIIYDGKKIDAVQITKIPKIILKLLISNIKTA
jgi:hypothetical protein